MNFITVALCVKKKMVSSYLEQFISQSHPSISLCKAIRDNVYHIDALLL